MQSKQTKSYVKEPTLGLEEIVDLEDGAVELTVCDRALNLMQEFCTYFYHNKPRIPFFKEFFFCLCKKHEKNDCNPATTCFLATWRQQKQEWKQWLGRSLGCLCIDARCLLRVTVSSLRCVCICVGFWSPLCVLSLVLPGPQPEPQLCNRR